MCRSPLVRRIKMEPLANNKICFVLRGVYKEMDRLQAPIEEYEVDRAHRSGAKYKNNDGKWQQPVLLKFNS